MTLIRRRLNLCSSGANPILLSSGEKARVGRGPHARRTAARGPNLRRRPRERDLTTPATGCSAADRQVAHQNCSVSLRPLGLERRRTAKLENNPPSPASCYLRISFTRESISASSSVRAWRTAARARPMAWGARTPSKSFLRSGTISFTFPAQASAISARRR